jgi:hypothetical protein
MRGKPRRLIAMHLTSEQGVRLIGLPFTTLSFRVTDTDGAVLFYLGVFLISFAHWHWKLCRRGFSRWFSGITCGFVIRLACSASARPV